MIDFINTNRTAHILTIEDPIEFLIRDKRSIVNQREIGVDTASFTRALRSALREDPDVILVGEMRDLETIEIAMTAAETGHLVMSTVHTLDAAETITRVIAAFPPYQQAQVRLQLGGILKAVISQRLVPKADGRGRVAAVEVLRQTARTRELIEDAERTKELIDAITEGFTSYGMQSFDQSLMGLLTSRLITYEEALRQSTKPDDFALRVSGIGGTSDSSWDQFDGDGTRPGMGETKQRAKTGATRRSQVGAPARSQTGAPTRSQTGAPLRSQSGAPQRSRTGNAIPTQSGRPVRSTSSGTPVRSQGGAEEFKIERFGD